MRLLKEDLAGNHYIWTGVAEFSGSPSRRLFDRFNGNQVLFVINFLGSLSEGFSLQDGHHIEELIMNNVPADAKSEVSVFNWLKDMESPIVTLSLKNQNQRFPGHR